MPKLGKYFDVVLKYIVPGTGGRGDNTISLEEVQRWCKDNLQKGYQVHRAVLTTNQIIVTTEDDSDYDLLLIRFGV